jgi:FdhD protein
MTRRVAIAPILRYGDALRTGQGPRAQGQGTSDQDLVAVESPLEVVLSQDRRTQSLGVLMRTPGDDRDLILGLLLGEDIIRAATDVVSIDSPPPDARDEAARATVTLAPHVDLSPVAGRTLTGTSACGLCGRLALQALDRGHPRTPDAPKLAAGLIAALPGALRSQQTVFAETGGLHAAGLFDIAGTPHVIREDVGRHNAVDKVIGAALAAGKVPARDALLVVSGRVAYEIVQKAAAGGVPFVVAVGAPSSLAVEAARATGITLVGFVRDGRFNVYSGADRVEASSDSADTPRARSVPRR